MVESDSLLQGADQRVVVSETRRSQRYQGTGVGVVLQLIGKGCCEALRILFRRLDN